MYLFLIKTLTLSVAENIESSFVLVENVKRSEINEEGRVFLQKSAET